MSRHGGDWNPEAAREAEEKLVNDGCDRAKLRRLTALAMETREKGRSEDRFGLAAKTVKQQAQRLIEEADTIERFLGSPFGHGAIEAMAELEKHPEFVTQTEDLPRRLKNLAIVFQTLERAFSVIASKRVLPAVTEHALLRYVFDATGGLHFEEVASLLGCDPENLKQRYYSFKKSRTGAESGRRVALLLDPE